MFQGDSQKLAKSAGPAPKAVSQSQPSQTGDADKKNGGAKEDVVVAGAPQDADKPQADASNVPAPANVAALVDLNSFAKAREALEQQLKFWALAIEDTNRSWRQFDDQVGGASSELVRLRDMEKEFTHLSTLHSQEMAKAEATRLDLADTRTRETAATERAAKLEDICEQIKERAMEIHTALQASRANEQKLQSELKTAESELVLLRRTVQEEEAGRVAAEDRNGKMLKMLADLEAVETEARERVAKLADENKVLSQQLPQLLADRNSWEKQFSASERENTRMQTERKMQADRVNELESEIRTLRADLASLTGGRTAPANDEPKAEPVKASNDRASDNIGDIEGDIEADDFDLVSSLDRAFSGSDEPDPKRSH